jgi:hypothetical protein
MEREKIGERHWVHITFGENLDDFQKYHPQYGLGEVVIGKTVVTDTTVFEKVNYEELYEVAKVFINDKMK